MPRQPPVTADEWERLRDDEGRISSEKEQLVKARVFAGVRNIEGSSGFSCASLYRQSTSYCPILSCRV